jgi:hypothetical protein
MLAALIDRGPYPALAFAGEQGTAKSTASKILRALIDPNTAPLRALPRNDRELFISATNAHLLVFDNVSGLSPWLSDTLCRLSSGGGFSVRSLWTNNDEVLFDAARPIILNGIGDVITRPDLADRALFITLKLIPDTERRSDSELLAAFEGKRARILGVLVDALAVGLKRLPTIDLPEKPRMADFAEWATACELAFWEEGTFMTAYTDNLIEVVDTVIEADLVGSAIRQMSLPWEGTASRLLSLLRDAADEGVTRSRDWPTSPEALANRLRRAATFLRKAGVEVSFDRKGKQSTRTISIKKGGGQPSAPSASSAKPSVASDFKNLEAGGLADGTSGLSTTAGYAAKRSAKYSTNNSNMLAAAAASASADSTDQSRTVGHGGATVGHDPTLGLNPLKHKAADRADGSDGSPHPTLGGGKRIRI